MSARRCEVCGSTLPPVTGRGRPRTVCRDEDSPSGRTGARSCRQIRNNRRDESKRDHRYAASMTLPGAFPGVDDVLGPGETLASRMHDAGFHMSTPEGKDYLNERRAHLAAVHQDELIQRARRASETQARQERQALCRDVCPLWARHEPGPDVVASLVERRLARRARE